MMKKSLILLLALVLLLSACASSEPGKTVSGEENATATATEPVPTKEVDFEYPTITSVKTEQDLDQIPVAQPGMTEDELRAIVVDAMQFQLNLVWTPSEKVSYSYPAAGASDADGMLRFHKGIRYGGLPYTQAASDVTPLLDRLDPETGVLNVEKLSMMDTIGNNCATAVYWAWARVSTTQKGFGTHNLCPKNNVVLLGDLETELNGGNYEVQSTKAIIEQNGDQKIFAAYASAKRGDGLVGYVKGGQHHAMLLTEDPHVVRNADGTINGTDSYVIVSEEYSRIHAVRGEDGQIQRVGGLNNKYSFQTLMRKFYLAISVAELQDPSLVEKAEVSLDLPEETALADLGEAKVKSNYAVSRVITRFTDESGKTVYESRRYGAAKGDPKELGLFSGAATAAAVRRSIGVGTFRLEVSVRLANGENSVVYQGKCTIS